MMNYRLTISHGLALVTLLLLLFGPIWPVHAQQAITVVSDEHSHVFLESITFRLNAKSTSDITSAKLFYRIAGQTSSHKVELEFEPAASIELEHVEDMSDPSNYQPPMIGITYWWLLANRDGDQLKTDPVAFVYEDTRYEWDHLDGDLVRLYWHDQDQAFGQRYFDAAVAAAEDLSREFGVAPKDPVSIVIYNSHSELMSSLQEGSAEWTGAVTFGEKGAVAIGLGDSSWMEKVIPHELTHAMLYQVIKPPFGDIPRWLHEGLAMRSEGGMSLEERAALDAAIRDDSLLSLRVLNSTFADARDQAILSYAESNSLVTFIIDEYGSDKMGELIAIFAEGAHYDDALIEVFGVDMDGMEDLWRAHIGASPRTGETRATPVPSARPEATATQVVAVPTSTAVQTPTATARAAEAQATPAATQTSTAAQTPTATARTATPNPAAPCLGAAPALAVLALFLFVRPRPAR